jgi:hypothetical protein
MRWSLGLRAVPRARREAAADPRHLDGGRRHRQLEVPRSPMHGRSPCCGPLTVRSAGRPQPVHVSLHFKSRCIETADLRQAGANTGHSCMRLGPTELGRKPPVCSRACQTAKQPLTSGRCFDRKRSEAAPRTAHKLFCCRMRSGHGAGLVSRVLVTQVGPAAARVSLGPSSPLRVANVYGHNSSFALIKAINYRLARPTRRAD